MARSSDVLGSATRLQYSLTRDVGCEQPVGNWDSRICCCGNDGVPLASAVFPRGTRPSPARPQLSESPFPPPWAGDSIEPGSSQRGARPRAIGRLAATLTWTHTSLHRREQLPRLLRGDQRLGAREAYFDANKQGVPRLPVLTHTGLHYSDSNPWLLNFNVRQFSVTVRFTFSETPFGSSTWISIKISTFASGRSAKC